METDVDSYPRMADEVEGEDLSASDIEGEVQCPVCAQVLMDPMTLSCGHSFCQICLARLWKSKFPSRQSGFSSTLLCPTCRHPWGQMPQINIQLRCVCVCVHMCTGVCVCVGGWVEEMHTFYHTCTHTHRNIVESVYKVSMDERRQSLTPQDHMLLDSFSKARVRRVRPLAQDLTPVVKVIVVLFLILGAFVVSVWECVW